MHTLLSRLFFVSPAERSIALPAHTSLQLRLKKGTQLVCVAGSLQVQAPPAWIAETLLASSQQLDEGGHYALWQTGWTTLRAGRTGVRLQMLAPASALSRMAAAARLIAQALQAMGQRGIRARRSPQLQ